MKREHNEGEILINFSFYTVELNGIWALFNLSRVF